MAGLAGLTIPDEDLPFVVAHVENLIAGLELLDQLDVSEVPFQSLFRARWEADDER